MAVRFRLTTAVLHGPDECLENLQPRGSMYAQMDEVNGGSLEGVAALAF